MSLTQKIGIVAFLTMNVWLIVINLIRASSIQQGKTFDLTWAMFLQFLEPNIAILAACFSAFRSIFVVKRSRAGRYETEANHPLRQQPFERVTSDHQRLEVLPAVPGAVLMGTHTAVWQGEGTHSTSIQGRNLHSKALDCKSEQILDDYSNRIHVQRAWSLASTKV